MNSLPEKYNVLFSETKKLLTTKYSASYANKLSEYSNLHVVYPKIPLPDYLRNTQYQQKMSWAKKALRVYNQHLTFDAFKNDNLGFTRLFYETGADRAVKSCIDKALFAGVSFLWVFKDNSILKNKFLVRSAQTTVVVKNDKNKIMFALTTVNNENSVSPEYFVYTEDSFYKVSNEGIILEKGSNKNIDILVFSVDSDYGARNIGKSIFSESFFTAQKNASIEHNLMQQGALMSLTNKNIILAQGIDPTMTDTEGEEVSTVQEQSAGSTGVSMLINPNTSGNISIETLADIDIAGIKELIRENAKIAASEVFLTTDIFGYAEGKEGVEDSGFKERIKSIRGDFSSTISQLGLTLMKNYLSLEENDATWGELVVKYEEIVDISKIGQIGDALYKMNELGVDISSVTDSLLGKNLKEEKMTIALPTKPSNTIVEETSVEESIKREQEFLSRLTELTENSGENNSTTA